MSIYIILTIPFVAVGQITVTNTNDTGTGSLRWAIDQANGTSGLSTIEFNIPGDGPHVIQPQSQFVSFVEPVILDAATQSGFSAGSPKIVLDGSQGGDISGLVFTGTADNSTVKGLSIINFENFGIRFISDSNTVQGNLIGIDPKGNAAGNGDGISMLNTSGNLIGGTLPEHRNVISGNNIGIDMAPGSGNNVVEGNYIGTNVDGTAAIGNKFNVQVRGSVNNRIGGNTPEQRNIVAGAFFEEIDGQNTGGSGIVLTVGTNSSGIPVNPTGNLIQGNYIGTDVTGTVSLANERAGVLLLFGSNGNQIGGEAAGEGNLISGNGLYGIFLQGNDANPVNSNLIQGNYIGTDVSGTAALPNDVGIWNMGNSDANLIGTNGTPDGGNLISGNGVSGILILEGEENQIKGNLVGTDADGLQAVPNERGIEIQGNSNTVGGNNPEDRNIISGNNLFGIYLNESADNKVPGNYIGTDVTGGAAIPGQFRGVRISGGSEHEIANNTISGHDLVGIQIDDQGTSSTGGTLISIKGNKIGTDINGTQRIPNLGGGILLSGSSNNIIGGTLPEDRNIVSGSGGVSDGTIFINPGISIQNKSDNNMVQGNYIGTDVNGAVVTDFGNFSHGIDIRSGSTGNVIGLDENGSGAGNIIAGNGVVNGNGVTIRDNSLNNRVSGNQIFSNDGIGIDLENDGITVNDIDDPDTGANKLQNNPELNSTTINTTISTISVSYTVSSDPVNSVYPLQIEFYLNDGTRQGKEFLGSDSYLLSDFGTVKQTVFSIPPGLSVSAGDEVTAIATDGDGNTSEFGGVSTLSDAMQIVTASWTGDGDGISWSDPANWSTNSVPGENTDVVIDANLGDNFTIEVSNPFTIRSLNISQADATLSLMADLDISEFYSHTRGAVTGTGNITVNGLVTWQGGTMGGTGTTLLNGGMEITGSAGSSSSNKFLDQRRLVCPAGQQVTIAGNRLNGISGGTIELEPEAVLDITTANNSQVMQAGEGGASLINAGTIRKTEGTTFTIDIQWDVVNSGLIELNLAEAHLKFTGAIQDDGGTYRADAGFLELALPASVDPYVFGSGSEFLAAAGARLNLGSQPGSSDETIYELGGTIQMDGIFSVKNFSGTPVANARILSSANLVSLGGELLLVGDNRGRLTVETTDALQVGEVRVGFSGHLELSSPLTVAGNYTQDNASAVVVSDFDIVVNGLVTWQGGTMGGTGTTLLNGGMEITGSAGSSSSNKFLDQRRLVCPAGQQVTIAGNRLNGINGGTIELEPEAVLDITTANNTQVMQAGEGGASLINAGTIRKTEGTTSTIDIQWDVQNSGVTEFAQENTEIKFSGSFSNQGSFQLLNETVLAEFSQTLENTGTVLGTGTIKGVVQNSDGVVSPGTEAENAGILSIDGSYVQSPDSRLIIDIGGVVASESFDQLITNTADLDGTIEFRLLNEFVPADSDVFEVITWTENSRNGIFSTIEGRESQDVFLELNYDTEALIVSNSSDNAPPASIPDIPVLVSPENESVDVVIEPVLDWAEANRAETYKLQVSLDSEFTNTVIDSSGIVNTMLQVPALDFETVYYWRVRATNSLGDSDYSETWSFTTGTEPLAVPPAPQLLSPENGALDIELEVQFSWEASGEADTYKFQLSLFDNFSSLVLEEENLESASLFVENLEELTKYYWRVRAVNTSGESDWSDVWNFTTMVATSIEDQFSEIPAKLELDQNYPNPFNPSTQINFGLPESGTVKLQVFDLLGRKVMTLIDGTMQAGRQSITFDASNLPSGMYLYRLETSSNVLVRKMMLIK